MNDECSICLENLGYEKKKLKYCNHFFHSECVNKWCKTHNTCPVCREPIHKVIICKIGHKKKFYKGLIGVKDGVFAFKTINDSRKRNKVNLTFQLSDLKSLTYQSLLKIVYLKINIGEEIKIFKIKFSNKREMSKCIHLFIHHINKVVTDDLKISV